MNFSIIIPTYNRPKDLEECLSSILSQTIKATEVIVIDDGNLSDDFIAKQRIFFHNHSIGFIYYRKKHIIEHRGSSESRNKALEIAQCSLVFILDDDVILDQDYLEKIMAVWGKNTDPCLIGVGGVIKNHRRKPRLEKIYNYIFGLTSKYLWDINDVGFQVWDEDITATSKGYYAHGGVCSYNKELAKKLQFTVFNCGRTALEDIDFCQRAKNNNFFFIVEPLAMVYHKASPSGRENFFLMGYKEGKNRKIIFKNNSYKNTKNYTWFIWANIGWILRQFLAGHFVKGAGMIKGLLSITN